MYSVSLICFSFLWSLVLILVYCLLYNWFSDNLMFLLHDGTAVELLAEIVQGNALDEKEIDRQKSVLLKELEASVACLTWLH